MTIEQYLKAQLGELQFALAAAMAERDAFKAKLEEVQKSVASVEKKKE